MELTLASCLILQGNLGRGFKEKQGIHTAFAIVHNTYFESEAPQCPECMSGALGLYIRQMSPGHKSCSFAKCWRIPLHFIIRLCYHMKYSSFANYDDFYRTRVRSLAMLVTHSLTDSLTNWLLFSKLDWCDPGLWRCQLKTCWDCYCCWLLMLRSWRRWRSQRWCQIAAGFPLFCREFNNLYKLWRTAYTTFFNLRKLVTTFSSCCDIMKQLVSFIAIKFTKQESVSESVS